MTSAVIDDLARRLCECATEFGWLDSMGRPLRPWETLQDGSSRAEYELTAWRQLAVEALETSGASISAALEARQDEILKYQSDNPDPFGDFAALLGTDTTQVELSTWDAAIKVVRDLMENGGRDASF